MRRADLQIDGGQVGARYAALTPAAAEAMRLAARTEGIFLDPTYTARALAGLVACVADGRIQPGHRTVFPADVRVAGTVRPSRTPQPDRVVRNA